MKQVIHLAESSNGLSIVSVSGGMELIYNSFFDLYRKILDDYRGGQGKGIKWVINMEGKEGTDLVKKFIDLGMQIRHVKNLSSMNFAVGDKEVNATIEKMEGGKMVQSLLTSNEPHYSKSKRRNKACLEGYKIRKKRGADNLFYCKCVPPPNRE